MDSSLRTRPDHDADRECQYLANVNIYPLRVTSIGALGQTCAAGGQVDLTIKLSGPCADGASFVLFSTDGGVVFSTGTIVVLNSFERYAHITMYFPDNADPVSTVSCTMPNGLTTTSAPFYVKPMMVTSFTSVLTVLSDGQSTDCTLTLSGTPTNDVTVTLTPGSFLTCPSTVVIPAGSKQAVFTVTAKHSVRLRYQTVRATVGTHIISHQFGIHL